MKKTTSLLIALAIIMALFSINSKVEAKASCSLDRETAKIEMSKQYDLWVSKTHSNIVDSSRGKAINEATKLGGSQKSYSDSDALIAAKSNKNIRHLIKSAIDKCAINAKFYPMMISLEDGFHKDYKEDYFTPENYPSNGKAFYDYLIDSNNNLKDPKGSCSNSTIYAEYKGYVKAYQDGFSHKSK